jgi:molybdopterin synthase sulfur carrier subunit
MRDSATTLSVRLVYLARLREAFGSAGESLELAADRCTVEALLASLRARGGAFATELDGRRAVRVAVNHVLARSGDEIRDGDEVALFPPVTGG